MVILPNNIKSNSEKQLVALRLFFVWPIWGLVPGTIAGMYPALATKQDVARPRATLGDADREAKATADKAAEDYFGCSLSQAQGAWHEEADKAAAKKAAADMAAEGAGAEGEGAGAESEHSESVADKVGTLVPSQPQALGAAPKDQDAGSANAESSPFEQWHALGVSGGGQGLSSVQCFVKALEAAESSDSVRSDTADTWLRLAQRLSRVGQEKVIVAEKELSRKMCYDCVVLRGSPSDSHFWIALALGTGAGGEVDGQTYDEAQCYLRALEIDPRSAPAWNSLGVKYEGKEVLVLGETCSEVECYKRALAADRTWSPSWRNLGIEGGVELDGKTYTKVDCYIKSIENDAEYHVAWNSLGSEVSTAGGIVQVAGKSYTEMDCYVRALEINPGYSTAWRNLGLEVCADGLLYSLFIQKLLLIRMLWTVLITLRSSPIVPLLSIVVLDVHRNA